MIGIQSGPACGGFTVASMGDMGAGTGMLAVETIAKIGRAYFVQKKPIKLICRGLIRGGQSSTRCCVARERRKIEA